MVIVKTRLNLATQPFRNRALPWTVTAVVTIFSILALVLILRATFQQNAQAQAVERDVKSMQSEADTARRRAEEVKNILTPDQQRTLKAAHALVDRKRFSWTRLFADLEAAMPGGVRVVRIAVKEVGLQGDREIAILDLTVASKSPTTVTETISDLEAAMPGGVRVVRIAVKEVGLQGDREIAILDLTVASKSPTTVTEMISDWEREGVFRAELVSQNLQRGRGESGAEYEMNVHYTPRSSTPIEPSERATRPVDTAPNGSNRTR